MNKIKIKLAAFFILIVFMFLLLEVGSWFVITFVAKKNIDAISNSFVFNQVNNDGSFVPNKNYVIPVKTNIQQQWVSKEFNIRIITNSDGYRENFNFDLDSIKIAFFGDSFTFGHGVNVENRFSNIYASLQTKYSNQEIVSMSYVNGFQPEHYEFFIRNNNDLRPDLYLIGLYLGNDLYSDVNETYYDVENNKLQLPYRLIGSTGQWQVNRNLMSQPWKSLSQYSFFGKLSIKLIGKNSYRNLLFKSDGPNSHNSHDLELGNTDLNSNRAIKSIFRLNQIIKDRDSKLIVIIIPQNFYVGYCKVPHIHETLNAKQNIVREGNNLLKQVKNIFEESEITFIDPTPVLNTNDYFELDGHWNNSGHKKIAYLLSDLVANLND